MMLKKYQFLNYPPPYAKILSIMIVLGAVFLYGCRVQREEINPIAQKENLLEKVKAHYFKNKRQNKSAADEKGQDYPQFQKGIIKTLPNGENIIAYPVYNKESYQYSDRIGYVKRYVVRLDTKDSIIETKTFEMIGDKEFLGNEKDNIPSQYYSGNMPTDKFVLLLSNKENPIDTTKISYSNVVLKENDVNPCRIVYLGYFIDFEDCSITTYFRDCKGIIKTIVNQTADAICAMGGGLSNPTPYNPTTPIYIPWLPLFPNTGGYEAGLPVFYDAENCPQDTKPNISPYETACQDVPLNGCNGTLNDNTQDECGEESVNANIPDDLDPKLKAIISDKFTPKKKNGIPKKQKQLNNEQWKVVNQSFKKLHEKSCIFRAMVKDFTDKGLKIEMGHDEDIEHPAEVAGKQHLVFGKNFFNYQYLNTIHLSHEFFHLFQNNVGDPIYTFTNGVNEGKMNREFEAYFFTELIEYAHDEKVEPATTPMGGRLFMFNYETTKYADFKVWIESANMNNNRTQYPTQINQDSLHKYMDRFKDVGMGKKYTTYQIKYNQKLKALEKLISLANNANCTTKN